MAQTLHLFPTEEEDTALLTVPVPRFPGMDWPGDDEMAQVPVALLLAARGRCSCAPCCEAFVHMSAYDLTWRGRYDLMS